MDVSDQFGGIDIYLFDQIQKGRFNKNMKILDIGCGNGRNLLYFMREGYNVFGIDKSQTFIKNIRFTAKQLSSDIQEENFQVASMEQLPFEDNQFDCAIASAVFHFAKDEVEFMAWLGEAWRVLKVGGIFFARLASDVGIENKIKQLEGRRFHLPDGSDRFLINQRMLIELSEKLNGEFIEPLKTTNVQNMRCMTTWVLQKHGEKDKTDPRLNDSRGIKLFRE